MLNKLLDMIRRYDMIRPGDRITVALSGGADSVALLYGLYLLREKLSIRLEAAHFNHGLRGAESDRDEAFCRRFCDHYDIPIHVGHGTVTAGKKGLEAAARDARYGFFDTIPIALDEAAMLDGATKWQVLCHIIMPLSKPIIVYTLLTSFAGPFKDFMLAKVLCGPNKDYYTVAVGMYQMLEMEYIDQWFCAFAAAAVIISIPIASLFLATQKYYATGISGAVKG